MTAPHLASGLGQILDNALDNALAAHADLRARVDSLDGHVGEHAATAGGTMWRDFATSVRQHMDDEEGHLFPALRQLAAGEAPPSPAQLAVLQAMAHEQEELRSLSDGLGPLAGVDPAVADLMDDLVAALDAHAMFESDVLRVAAIAALEAWGSAQDEPPAAPADARTVRETRGRCNTCLAEVPARVVRRDDEVVLEKQCPEHGITAQRMSGSGDYWETLDRFYFEVNHENYPQRDYIVRMTERCNLDCPICLAKANTEDTPDLDLSGLEELLAERRGIKVDLMAAEPTLRDDLHHWIRRVKATGNIAALHTNGLKLADPAYCQSLADAGVDEVFLQFDGFDETANKVLRGRPLLKARLRTLENLRASGIATSLIVVIGKDLNEDEIAQTYRFALQPENDHIREVFFMGLRLLGSARDALVRGESRRGRSGSDVEEMTLMPDDLIEILCRSTPDIDRDDVLAFNKLYFAMLSAFQVKKCLYVQHYFVARDGQGGATPASGLMDLPGLARAAERYADTFERHPTLARARLVADIGRYGISRESARMLADLVRLQNLFRSGMNLRRVPRRFLLLGFITACDPYNFDSQVAVNCGKGELSADGGFVESGAVANVRREVRFSESDRTPGKALAKTRPS